MDLNERKALGQRIKKRREEKDITQEALAKSVHKSSPAYIALIESGDRNVSTIDLLLISKQLGITVAELVGEEKELKKPKFIEALRSSSDLTTQDRKKLEEYYSLLVNQKKK